MTAFNHDYYFGNKVRSGFDGEAYQYHHPGLQQQLVYKWADIPDPYRTILFVGCGPGYEVKYWRERGKMAYGCDVSKFALDWMEQNDPKTADYCFLMESGRIPAMGLIDIVAAFDCLTLVPVETRQQLIEEMCAIAETRIVFRTITFCASRHPVRPDGFHGEDGILFRYEPMDYWIEAFERSGKFKLDRVVTHGLKVESIFSFKRM